MTPESPSSKIPPPYLPLPVSPVLFRTPTLDGRELAKSSGQAALSLVGRTVSLAGWIDTVRDHGDVVFFDWRDAWGGIQILCSPEFTTAESFHSAKHAKPESVVSIEGFVRVRPDGTENTREALGTIEIVAHEFRVLSAARTPPFPLEDEGNVSEAVLLRHRYLHLRTPRMRRNLRLRAALARSLREAFEAEDFLEVETPTLFKATPEGARDFLVPSRTHKGSAYALIQSPQMLKQLLMVGGLGRYMQVARCYRDEDSRADRQPEFTQLDLEASFLSQNDFLSLVENCLLGVLRALVANRSLHDQGLAFSCLGEGGREIPLSLARVPYAVARGRLGSDKPDGRFPLPLHNVTPIFQTSAFEIFQRIASKANADADVSGNLGQNAGSQGCIKMICLPATFLREELPRSFLDTLPALAKTHGGNGLAWVRLQDDGSWQGPAGKFFSQQEREALLAIACEEAPELSFLGFPALTKADLGPGTMLFFSGSSNPDVVHDTLGALRLLLGASVNAPESPLAASIVFPHTRSLSLFWVTDWPLFEWEPHERRLTAAHHPFTSPSPNSLAAFLAASAADAKHLGPGGGGAAGAAGASGAVLGRLEAQAFDLVFNGAEVGGGSVRIHDATVQEKMFELLGLSAETAAARFGFFLEALRFGTPPHAGMALGLDRLTALLAGEKSLRDVIAFPKSGTGACLLSQCPTPMERTQLVELGLNTLALKPS
ncbi:MAG: aspartate--tRNA ligase [Silvanigrellales bacterium]|nr:aspartate--tRNA ligase [Silvanigrellales bacterium]